MKNHRSRLVAHIAGCLLAAIPLLIGLASVVLAQQGSGRVSAPPIVDPKGETHEMQNRESLLRSGERSAEVEKRNEQRLQAAIEQTKQDFKRIQIIRNEMVDTLLANKPPDYKLISDESGEINKRALRLKTFLMPPDVEEKEKNKTEQTELESAEMKGALVKLCNLIYSFTENPVLKNLSTVDVQQSAKAGRDLQSIIELSANVKRSAERLKNMPR